MCMTDPFSHRCLHPDVPFLEAGDFYWKLKDSVAKYELLLLRALKFKLNIQLPHPVRLTMVACGGSKSSKSLAY